MSLDERAEIGLGQRAVDCGVGGQTVLGDLARARLGDTRGSIVSVTLVSGPAAGGRRYAATDPLVDNRRRLRHDRRIPGSGRVLDLLPHLRAVLIGREHGQVRRESRVAGDQRSERYPSVGVAGDQVDARGMQRKEVGSRGVAGGKNRSAGVARDVRWGETGLVEHPKSEVVGTPVRLGLDVAAERCDLARELPSEIAGLLAGEPSFLEQRRIAILQLEARTAPHTIQICHRAAEAQGMGDPYRQTGVLELELDRGGSAA